MRQAQSTRNGRLSRVAVPLFLFIVANTEHHFLLSSANAATFQPRHCRPALPRGNAMIQVRCGASYDSSDPYASSSSPEDYNPLQQQQQQQQQPQDQSLGSPDSFLDSSTSFWEGEEEGGARMAETEQDRVERWKMEQREQARLTAQSIPNKGLQSTSLMQSVSKGSRALIFFLLMWRNIHLYEMADRSIKSGGLRTLLVTPLVFLFVANLIGALQSLNKSPGHATKRRLKAILNADKMVEGILLIFYLLRLTILPSKYTTQEVYIANIFHSVLFLIQCQAFTRVSWSDDLGSSQPSEFLVSQDEEEREDYVDTDDMGQRLYPQQQGMPYQQQQRPQYGDSRYQPYNR